MNRVGPLAPPANHRAALAVSTAIAPRADIVRQTAQGETPTTTDTVLAPLAEDGATATEIQALLGHQSLNTSQGYIDANANATRQAARANRTHRNARAGTRRSGGSQ